jgi:hypothetical protein
MKERDHLEDIGVDEKILHWIFGKEDGRVWTGCMSVRTGTSGEFL